MALPGTLKAAIACHGRQYRCTTSVVLSRRMARARLFTSTWIRQMSLRRQPILSIDQPEDFLLEQVLISRLCRIMVALCLLWRAVVGRSSSAPFPLCASSLPTPHPTLSKSAGLHVPFTHPPYPAPFTVHASLWHMSSTAHTLHSTHLPQHTHTHSAAHTLHILHTSPQLAS